MNDDSINLDLISEITWANYKIAKEAERIKDLEERGYSRNSRNKTTSKGLGSSYKSK